MSTQNFFKIKSISRGFTLIELLVVIAIISLLSSIVMASLNSARAKARDAKAVGDFKQLSTALAMYYDKYGRYPNVTPVTTNQWMDNFNSMATQLVAEKFLSAVPVAPQNHTYNYYYYTGSPAIGGLLVTTMETMTPTTQTAPGTCRPFNTGNWCDVTRTTNYYCICNPF